MISSEKINFFFLVKLQWSLNYMKTNTSGNYQNTLTLIVDTCSFYRFFRKNIFGYYWNNPTLFVDTYSFYRFLSKLHLFQKWFSVLFICGLHFTDLPSFCFVFKQQHMMGYESFYFSCFWFVQKEGTLYIDLTVIWKFLEEITFICYLPPKIFIAWRAKMRAKIDIDLCVFCCV